VAQRVVQPIDWAREAGLPEELAQPVLRQATATATVTGREQHGEVQRVQVVRQSLL